MPTKTNQEIAAELILTHCSSSGSTYKDLENRIAVALADRSSECANVIKKELVSSGRYSPLTIERFYEGLRRIGMAVEPLKPQWCQHITGSVVAGQTYWHFKFKSVTVGVPEDWDVCPIKGCGIRRPPVQGAAAPTLSGYITNAPQAKKPATTTYQAESATPVSQPKSKKPVLYALQDCHIEGLLIYLEGDLDNPVVYAKKADNRWAEARPVVSMRELETLPANTSFPLPFWYRSLSPIEIKNIISCYRKVMPLESQKLNKNVPPLWPLWPLVQLEDGGHTVLLGHDGTGVDQVYIYDQEKPLRICSVRELFTMLAAMDQGANPLPISVNISTGVLNISVRDIENITTAYEKDYGRPTQPPKTTQEKPHTCCKKERSCAV